eukprot:569192-Pyramimonas_sp.AAC.1
MSDLWVQQANAPGHYACIGCAYQLCSCPRARVMFIPPSAHIKMTRNGRSRQSEFWPSKLPDRAEIKSGNKIEYHGKNTRAVKFREQNWRRR